MENSVKMTNFDILCEERGLTRAKVSEITHISASILYGLRKDHKHPSKTHISRLVQGLGITPEEAFDLFQVAPDDKQAIDTSKYETSPLSKGKQKYEEKKKAEKEIKALPKVELESESEPESESESESEPETETLESNIEHVVAADAEPPAPKQRLKPVEITVTRLMYQEAANKATKNLARVFGSDGKVVSLAAAYIIADIENELFAKHFEFKLVEE